MNKKFISLICLVIVVIGFTAYKLNQLSYSRAKINSSKSMTISSKSTIEAVTKEIDQTDNNNK